MGIDNSIDHWDKSDIAQLRKNMLHLPALKSIGKVKSYDEHVVYEVGCDG
jgi:hypothetical protein